jgi:Flp pilus assembly protein TadG
MENLTPPPGPVSKPIVWKPILSRLRAFVADRSGVGAVEFALIAPLLLMLYITAFEITMGLSMAKRVTRSASSIADLVTQRTSVDKTVLGTMQDVAKSLFAPYAATNLHIKITGISMTSGSPQVAWSWDETNAVPYAVGSAVDVPTEMQSTDSFLVRSEVSVSHKLLMFMPGLMPTSLQEITIARQNFYRQRLGSAITCSGC